ncbi:anti-sigma regulatory factor (Ser/Thr protein kinase) [Halopolyspora algeriensis]|uniref:Anti-sigma regulatory factor (Ser/Thr protein kinase) n=1 Tax=Halopolyspora algeriensis TaxID=1500506 RepID=A0A368W293_9ACTN|nr:sensor histidine kinase [Halopolyspora algeriensis]RCW46098.1 anti-sigma regulatory factor (Ser/Thr protein kinase) [Halopolyspora algeriensis]TQM55503.1 anti-sigma regulatory factor (Ser/Thr protein kinase) [Halopolyspora algeriensis]
MTPSAATHPDRFVHEALFYDSDTDYLDELVPFITDGLAQRDPVTVAVPAPKLRLLREALDEDAGRVRMLDMTEAGRNPGRIIADVLHASADEHPHEHVRIIGEPIWSGRTATEYPACAQHEALINTAFTGRDVTIVCPYDTAGLDASALADAHATHPWLRVTGRRHASEHYAPEEVLARHNQPLGSVPDAATYPVTTAGALPGARRFATDHAQRLGLCPDRTVEWELIVTELVTNGLVHGGGDCLLRIGRDGDDLVCAVENSGTLADPLAGRRPPQPGQLGGRGLLLVHNLADLVRTHTSLAGTAIHAHLRLTSPR